MLPTPAKMPSMTSDSTTGFTPRGRARRRTGRSPGDALLHQALRPFAERAKESQNTSAMINRNAGKAV